MKSQNLSAFKSIVAVGVFSLLACSVLVVWHSLAALCLQRFFSEPSESSSSSSFGMPTIVNYFGSFVAGIQALRDLNLTQIVLLAGCLGIMWCISYADRSLRKFNVDYAEKLRLDLKVIQEASETAPRS